jgi:hypothetical protein
VEAVGTARLTDRIPADRAVAASIPSREIRDVLQDTEAAVELTLDVVAGDGSDEHGAISMTWSREDLEQLLAAATGDNVVLTFDRDELAAVLADVEAHGLRTRAAVFAVAAVGALGSGASIASAMPSGPEGGPAATPTAAVQSDTSQAALQARSEALNVQYGLGSSASDATVTDASTGGGYVTPSASDATVTDASTGGYAGDDSQAALQSRSEAMNAQFGLGGSPSEATVTDASTSGYVAPTQSDEATTAMHARAQALNEQYGLAGGGQDDSAIQALQARGEAMNAQFGLGGAPSDATVTDASTSGYVTPSTGDGSSFSIQAPSTDEALLAGAAALMIAGAAFTVRRTSAPRPA